MFQDKLKYNGQNIILTWFDSEKEIKKYKPVRQALCFCFNQKGKILIARKTKHSNWMLPGGTVEKGETPLQTAHREVDEEVSCLIDNVKLLGYQRVEFLDENRKPEYQVRYVANIKKMKTQKEDPDFGDKLELKFIKPKDFTKYLEWGNIGDHLAMKAKEFFEEQKKLK